MRPAVLVEVGSSKGQDLVGKFGKYFVKAKDSQISARDSKRNNLIDQLNKHLAQQNLPAKDRLQKIVKQGYNSQTWKDFCLKCVECGACNFICRTPHKQAYPGYP